MSVVEERSASKISAEAFDLLDCFVAGLDDVVYQMAEHIARHRLGKMNPAEAVEINADDVTAAGEQLIQLLREQLKQNMASSEWAPILDQVENCFRSRRAGGCS